MEGESCVTRGSFMVFVPGISKEIKWKVKVL